MPPFISGLLLGLVFIFSLGPSFFTLIQTSVQKGFFRAILFALGISLCDICYVTLSILGVSAQLEKPEVKMWMAIFGSILLLGYGTYNWFKKPVIYSTEQNNSLNNTSWKYLVKGFLINAFNPFIIIFWVSIMSLVAVEYDFTLQQEISFFAGVLVTILAMDLTKAFVANRLRYLITPERILYLNRFVSLILVAFGLRIVYFLFETYVWA